MDEHGVYIYVGDGRYRLAGEAEQAALVKTVQSNSYDALLREMQQQVNVNARRPLFCTDVDGKALFELFLGMLPAQARQVYTCNTCRAFVERYGGLVWIGERGELEPAVWPWPVPGLDIFTGSLLATRFAVLSASVTGMFFSNRTMLGKQTTEKSRVIDYPDGVLRLVVQRRHHFSIVGYRKSPWYASGMRAAKFKETRDAAAVALREAVLRYKRETIETALHTVLQPGNFWRDEPVREFLQALLTVHDCIDGAMPGLYGAVCLDARTRDNVIWLAAATMPIGYCHVGGTIVGRLLDDIEAGEIGIDMLRQRHNARVCFAPLS